MWGRDPHRYETVALSSLCLPRAHRKAEVQGMLSNTVFAGERWAMTEATVVEKIT